MKKNEDARCDSSVSPLTSEMLILADGRVLAHNLTPVMADVLRELNPGDSALERRAGNARNTQPATRPHELPG